MGGDTADRCGENAHPDGLPRQVQRAERVWLLMWGSGGSVPAAASCFAAPAGGCTLLQLAASLPPQLFFHPCSSRPAANTMWACCSSCGSCTGKVGQLSAACGLGLPSGFVRAGNTQLVLLPAGRPRRWPPLIALSRCLPACPLRRCRRCARFVCWAEPHPHPSLPRQCRPVAGMGALHAAVAAVGQHGRVTPACCHTPGPPRRGRPTAAVHDAADKCTHMIWKFSAFHDCTL